MSSRAEGERGPPLRRIAWAVPGLDAKRALSEAHRPAAQRLLDRNDGDSQLRGVNSTPSFFVGRTGARLEPLRLRTLEPSYFMRRIDDPLKEG